MSDDKAQPMRTAVHDALDRLRASIQPPPMPRSIRSHRLALDDIDDLHAQIDQALDKVCSDARRTG